MFYLSQWNIIIHGWYDTCRVKPKYPDENLSGWTKWYWESFLSEYFSFPISIVAPLHHIHINSSAIRAVESRQLTAPSRRHLPFPVTRTVTYVPYLPISTNTLLLQFHPRLLLLWKLQNHTLPPEKLTWLTTNQPSTEDNEGVELYLYSLCVPSWQVIRWPLSFTFATAKPTTFVLTAVTV